MNATFRSIIAAGVMIGVASAAPSIQAKDSDDTNGKPQPVYGTEVDGNSGCPSPLKLCHCFLSGMGVFDGSEAAFR